MISDATKDRLNKLDDAFLFMISVIGLLFTIIQGYTSGILGIFESVPILILGIPLPFYIGYVRGAISLPQTEEAIVERLRGWGYLIFGIGAYLSLIAPITPNLVPYGLFFYAGILFLSAVCAGYMQKWFIRTFGIGHDGWHQISYFGSVASAAFLAIALGYSVASYIGLSSSGSPYTYFGTILGVYIVGLAILGSIVFEKVSRMIVSDKTILSEREIGMAVRGGFMSRAVSGIMVLIELVLASSKRSVVLWSVSILIALAGSILLVSPSLKDVLWLTMPVSALCFVASLAFAVMGMVFFMRISKLKKLVRPRKRTSAAGSVS